MARKLELQQIFNDEAKSLTGARDKAIRVHGTGDIKAAGNEVEIDVREYFSRSLPSKYNVTHGHLINVHGNISPQLDMIVADNEKLPSLITTRDGTEYIPAIYVYAVGEIKSTYYKKENSLGLFQNKLKIIESDLDARSPSNPGSGAPAHRCPRHGRRSRWRPLTTGSTS